MHRDEKINSKLREEEKAQHEKTTRLENKRETACLSEDISHWQLLNPS